MRNASKNILVYVFCLHMYAFLWGSIIPNNPFEDFSFGGGGSLKFGLSGLKVLVLKGGMLPRKHGFSEF